MRWTEAFDPHLGTFFDIESGDGDIFGTETSVVLFCILVALHLLGEGNFPKEEPRSSCSSTTSQLSFET